MSLSAGIEIPSMFREMGARNLKADTVSLFKQLACSCHIDMEEIDPIFFEKAGLGE